MGGAGDDIITDRGGDDVIKGDDGNDVIQAATALNLIIGGTGKRLHHHRRGRLRGLRRRRATTSCSAARRNLPTLGNEGDDWIELGTQDGADRRQLRPARPRHASSATTCFIAGGGFDELIGEGGDDIMVGSDGEDHFDGGSGFDWASYKFDPYGVTADMIVNDFDRAAGGAVDRRHHGPVRRSVEGLSGSAFADVLRGDNADATEIAQRRLRTAACSPTSASSTACRTLLGDGVDLVRRRQHHPRRRRQRHHRRPRRQRHHRRRPLAERAHQRARTPAHRAVEIRSVDSMQGTGARHAVGRDQSGPAGDRARDPDVGSGDRLRHRHVLRRCARTTRSTRPALDRHRTTVTDNVGTTPAATAPTRCATSSGCSSTTRPWCWLGGRASTPSPVGVLTINDDTPPVEPGADRLGRWASPTRTTPARQRSADRPGHLCLAGTSRSGRAPACSSDIVDARRRQPADGRSAPASR